MPLRFLLEICSGRGFGLSLTHSRAARYFFNRDGRNGGMAMRWFHNFPQSVLFLADPDDRELRRRRQRQEQGRPGNDLRAVVR